MSEFQYRNNALYCENLSVKALAGRYGTPLYIYSRKAFENRYDEVRAAFSPLSPLICFSVKSNSNGAILKLLGHLGAGADIVSGGELYRCLKAGISPSKIVYAGVGKTDEEIRYALKSGIHLFNVESLPELRAINRIAGSLGKRARVGLRINPDVDAKTHAKTTTGKKENKFGLPISRAPGYFREAANLANIEVAAIDVHLGSPIFSVAPYVQALDKLLPLIIDLRRNGIPLSELDIGGGFGVRYTDQEPFTPAQLARAVLPRIRRTGLKFICEPGRYIAGNSGVLAAKVIYVKKTDVKNFIIVDTGMNDLIRPALYDSVHAIVPAGARNGGRITADVVGPICESSDFLGKGRRLPEPRPGDFLAVLTAGAYGFSMSSSYNSRPRACEILVSGSRVKIIRRRETYRDLIKGEALAI
jgi:diaminopimelate decarboxylase